MMEALVVLVVSSQPHFEQDYHQHQFSRAVSSQY